MPELFDEVSADAFALPGDEAALSRLPAADAANEELAAPEAEPQPQPRDERGRFTSPAEPEQHPQLAQEQHPVEQNEPEDDSLERFLAGQNIDPATASERELRLAKALLDSRQTIGRQSSELGDLRQLLDAEEPAWEAEPGQYVAAEQPPTGNVLLDNPAVALDVALQTGNTEAVPIVWQAWNERDPAAAQMWAVQKQAEQRVADVEQSYSARLQEAQAELERRKLMDDAATEIAHRTAVAAQQAREDAFVASTTVNSTGEKPSVAEQIAAEWDQILAARNDGWNVK